MKIVMVAPFGLRPKGTVRVRALPLARELVGLGHQVQILVPPWDDREAAGQDIEQAGVRIRQMPLPPHTMLDLPALTARMLRNASREAPDILHSFKPKSYSGLVAWGWRQFSRVGRSLAPLVTDSDDWEGPGGWNEVAPYSAAQKRFFAWQERWGLRHADAVTVASRTLESLVLSMGVPPARLLYLPNGPGSHWVTPSPRETDRLRQELDLDGRPVALLFTRFFEFDEQRFARRWARVSNAMPEARLLVVGEGLQGEEVRFRRALEDLQLSESVRLVGWQPFETLPRYFALARVALYPMADTLLNRTKCPVKLADYLQLALPVVGEAVGQVREYLAGEAGGLLVPPGDDDSFVAATIRLLSDEKLAGRLGRAGQQQLAERFDWPVQARRLDGLYRRLKHRN